MTVRHITLASLVMVVAFLAAPHADARPRLNKAKHADRNKDGRVDHKEFRAEKKFAHEKKAQVNTPWEKKADKDKDGVVEPAEARRAKVAGLKRRSIVDSKWEKAADANGDGRVGGGEARKYWTTVMDGNGDGKVTLAERNKFWVARRNVTTSIEKKYDEDEDGVLDEEEVEELLRDRLRIINTAGKAKVDSPVEAAFDANEDGVIDRNEAELIKAYLEV